MVRTKDILCPVCGGMLKHHDRVRRMVKTDYGKTYWIILYRKICTKCGKKHRVLPDILMPYKHYEARIINGFVTGEYDSTDLKYEDYPCENTIKLWIGN